MSQLLALLYNRFKPYFPAIYTVAIVAILFAIFYYVYTYVYLPKMDGAKFADVANASPTDKEVTIYMFHVDWCPHCKKALPEWNMFSDEYNGKSVNGCRINCKEIDCTNTDDVQVQAVMDKYGVKQYPTVIAVMGGTDLRIDYDAKVKKDHLEKFVYSITSK